MMGRRTRGTGIKNRIGNHTFRTTSRRQDEIGYIPQAVDGRATCLFTKHPHKSDVHGYHTSPAGPHV